MKTRCSKCKHKTDCDKAHPPKLMECEACGVTCTHVWLGPDHKDTSDAPG